jgi:hypothetical protein
MPDRHAEWLGLGPASRLLGVAPETLRRWSDSGRISSFTTPGGHRRYRRLTLERLLPGERAPRPASIRSGMTPARLARAYRKEARSAAQVMPWLVELTPEQRDWFRAHGRTLATILVQHLDASDDDVALQRLSEATVEAAGYGRMAATLGVSLSQAVEGFLQFRRPFLHQLGVFAGQRGLDAGSTSSLIESSERAMDRLLMAVMSAYTIEQADPRRGSMGDESEGLR